MRCHHPATALAMLFFIARHSSEQEENGSLFLVCPRVCFGFFIFFLQRKERIVWRYLPRQSCATILTWRFPSILFLFSRSRRKKKNAEQRYERWLQDFFPQSVKLSLSLLLWCILPAFVRFNCVSSPMSFFE